MDDNMFDLGSAGGDGVDGAPIIEKKKSTVSGAEKEELYRSLHHLRQAVRDDPKNCETIVELAKVMIQLGSFEIALEHLQHAVEINPSYAEAHVVLGGCYLKLGFPDRAASSYEIAIAVDHENEVPCMNLGCIAYSDDNYPKALDSFKKALKANPENREARKNAAQCSYMILEYKETLEFLKPNIEDGKTTHEDYAYYGLALDQLDRSEEAVSHLERAIDMNKENIVYLVNLANIYQKVNNIDKAEECYLKSIKLSPKNPVCWFNLGELHFLHKNPLDSIPFMEKVVELDPDDAEAWSILARVSTGSDPKTALTYLQKARQKGYKGYKSQEMLADLLEKNGRERDATLIRQELVNSDPFMPNNKYKLFQLYIKQGEMDKAIELSSEVAKIEVGDIKLFFKVSEVLRYSGRLHEEVNCLEKILQADKDFFPAKERIFNIAYESGYYSKSIELSEKFGLSNVRRSFRQRFISMGQLLYDNKIEDAIAMARSFFDMLKYSHFFWSRVVHLFRKYKHFDALMNSLQPMLLNEKTSFFCFIGFCKVLELNNFNTEFEKLIRKYLERHPGKLQVLNELGLFLLRNNRVDDAMLLIKEYSKRDKKNDLLVTMGECHFKNGETEKAEEIFELTIKQTPDHYRAYYNLGIVASKKGDDQKAIEHLDKSISIYDDDYRSWLNRGLIKMRNDDFDGAEKDVFRALSLSNRNSHIHYSLGKLYFQLEKYPSAKCMYLRSIVCNKKNKRAWSGLAEVFEEFGNHSKMQACIEQVNEIENESPSH